MTSPKPEYPVLTPYELQAIRESGCVTVTERMLIATLDAARAQLEEAKRQYGLGVEVLETALAESKAQLAAATERADQEKLVTNALREALNEMRERAERAEAERDADREAHKTELAYVDMSGREADAAKIAALEERCAELGEELSGERNAREVLLPALADAQRDLAAAQERERRKDAALESLFNGTRNYEARGLGQNLPVEYEMPPSTAKRVRKLIADALASSSENGGEK